MGVEGEGESESDDVNWTYLASFALFKLFKNWNFEGKPTVQAAVEKSSIPRPCQTLPKTAATMNPVALLHLMRPGAAVFEEAMRVGGTNPQVTIMCHIDGQTFPATAQRKKQAKAEAAKAACRRLFNIQYALNA